MLESEKRLDKLRKDILVAELNQDNKIATIINQMWGGDLKPKIVELINFSADEAEADGVVLPRRR